MSMLINKFFVDAEFLFSAKASSIIRKHGAQILLVEYWAKAIFHSEDGKAQSESDLADMLSFYTGLTTEKLINNFNVLLSLNLLQRNKDGLLYSDVISSDLQKVENKRKIYRDNISKRWKKKKESKELDTTVIQLNNNGNTNHQNQNQNQNTEYMNSKSINKKNDKKSIYNINLSIPKEVYKEILIDPSLCNGDREFLLTCCNEMQDWSTSKGEKRIDWSAALRNWIRRAKKDKNYKPKTKSLLEIAEELDRQDAEALSNKKDLIN